MAARVCSKCGASKPLRAFYKNPRGRAGRRSDCIECVLAERRRRYAEANAVEAQQVVVHGPWIDPDADPDVA